MGDCQEDLCLSTDEPEIKGRERHFDHWIIVVLLLVVAFVALSGHAFAETSNIEPFTVVDYRPGTYGMRIDRPGQYGVAIWANSESEACQDHDPLIKFYSQDDDLAGWAESCMFGFTHLGDFREGQYRVEVGGHGRMLIVLQHPVVAQSGESPASLDDRFERRVAHWFDGPSQEVHITVQTSYPVSAWVYDYEVNLVEDLGDGTNLQCTCEFHDFASRMLYVVLESSSDESIQASISVLAGNEGVPSPFSPNVILSLAVAATAGVGMAWWWIASRRT